MDGGLNNTLACACATPIGPKLNEPGDEKQKKFKFLFMDKLHALVQSDGSIGRMVTNMLIVEK